MIDQIPQSKKILFNNLQYFASIFEKIPQNSMTPTLYIVLPLDLSYQAMKILIHYMYRGESRVSNDILKEVLRAGDILKVRGLYRTDAGKENKQELKGIKKPESSTIRQPQVISQSTTPLNTSSNIIQNTENSNQKLISVINTPGQMPPHNNNASSIHNQQKYNYDPIVFANRKIGYKILQTIDNPVASVSNNATTKTLRQNVHHTSVQQSRHHLHESQTTPKTPSSHVVNFLTIKEEPVEWTEEYDVGEMKCDKEFHIKEEDHTMSIGGGSTSGNEMDVMSDRSTTEHFERSEQYQKLSCEICTEAFTQPADWVRHIERHSEHTAMIPRKRQRTEGVSIGLGFQRF